MNREQLIAAASTAVFTDGAVPLDLHFAMLGEGLDAQAIEHDIKQDIDEALYG